MSNNALSEEVLGNLRGFFVELVKQGEPHAIQVVRSVTGLDLRYDGDDVFLTPHMGVRESYMRWCWDCGWKVKSDGKGNVGRVCGWYMSCWVEEWMITVEW